MNVGGSGGVCSDVGIFFIILLGTKFPDYLKRIIVKLFLGYLKNLNMPLCLIHETLINGHPYVTKF